MTDTFPAEEHPMMAVPTAVRIVVAETCRLLQKGNASFVETINASDPNLWQQLYGRILEQDVVMSPPGYPPYTASVMDGYAFAIDDAESLVDTTQSETAPWTHVVRDKIYAGAAAKETTNESLISSESTNNDEDDDIQSTTSSKMVFHHDYSQLPAAYYITTGAMLPDHCDCVVPVEEVRIQEMEENDGSTTTLIYIPSSARIRNKWIRAPGCDIPTGTLLLQRKATLDPIAIGLLLQSGISSVKIRRKVTLGILSTGSELRMPSSTINGEYEPAHARLGTIPDINRPVLLSLFHSHAQLNVLDLQIVRDDDPFEDMLRVVTSAIEQCDIVISTGGISKGETDFVESLLMQKLPSALKMIDRPQLHFGRLHMKPGKPTTFFTIPKPTPNNGTCFWFALPGNPVSAYVCLYLLVWPCVHLLANGPPFSEGMDSESDDDDRTIQRMVDQALVHSEIERVELTQDIKLDVERPEYHRVRFLTSSSPENATIPLVKSTGVQQSSRFLSLQQADGLVLLPQGSKEKPMAKIGEQFLLLRLNGGNMTTPVHASHHLRMEEGSMMPPEKPPPLGEPANEVEPSIHPAPVVQKEPFRIGIIQLSPVSDNNFQFHAVAMDDDSLEDAAASERVEQEFIRRVEVAMSGAKSGPVQVVASQIFTGPVDRFYSTLIHGMIPDAPGVDLWVVIAKGNFRKHRGAYHHHMMLAHQLRKNLSKVATSMALQARRGATKQNPIVGALFEIVIGYVANAAPNAVNGTVSSNPVEESNGSLLILLPEEGLDLGLQNVRGLLKHAVRVARGTNDGHPSASKVPSSVFESVEEAFPIQ